MTTAALRARMRRLDELALEAARELQLEKQSDIFLWRELLEYRRALMQMQYLLESARVALAKTLRRLDGDCDKTADAS